jgi:hypothetical protein
MLSGKTTAIIGSIGSALGFFGGIGQEIHEDRKNQLNKKKKSRSKNKMASKSRKKNRNKG